MLEQRRSLLIGLLVLFAVISSQLAQGQTSGEPSGNASQSTSSGPSGHANSKDANAGKVKIAALLVIAAVGMLVDGVIIAFPQFRTNVMLMSICSSFAAGIFVVVGLAHMLAEGVEAVTASMDEGRADRFRPPYMTAIAGYFFKLFIHRGLFKVPHEHQLPPPAPKEQEATELPNEPTGTEQLIVASPEASPIDEPQTTANRAHPAAFPAHEAAPTPETQVESETHEDASAHSHTHSHDHGHSHGHDHGHAHGAHVRKSKAQERVNTIALFTVLCIHSLADGVSIGVQKTWSGTVSLFAAVVAHHWGHDMIFAFQTGRSMDSVVARLFWSFLSSWVTSFGIAIGWGLEASLPPVALGYISSFCAGTFLMIGMTDLIPEEMPAGRRNLPQLAAFFVGASAIYGLLCGVAEPEHLAP